MIVDLVPECAFLHFKQCFGEMTLSRLQEVILVKLGLQHDGIDALSAELDVPSQQILALFNKSIRKIVKVVQAAHESAVEASEPAKVEDTLAAAGAATTLSNQTTAQPPKHISILTSKKSKSETKSEAETSASDSSKKRKQGERRKSSGKPKKKSKA